MPARPIGATATIARIDADRENLPNLIVHLLAGPPRLLASRQVIVRREINAKSIPMSVRLMQELDIQSFLKKAYYDRHRSPVLQKFFAVCLRDVGYLFAGRFGNRPWIVWNLRAVLDGATRGAHSWWTSARALPAEMDAGSAAGGASKHGVREP
ncbi:hypothetical protein [Methylobacterium sp. J-026]|uniref:hypothetical protein n=1 Tax=Methylobacterium sp. J-026 TaxID=2836624 RepID=UPI001FB94317|nr:hypothetical protein [Methylobacterium sp. J-026]